MRYETFTFSTGIEVKVGKVSPTLIADIEAVVRRQWADRTPVVPTETVASPHGDGTIENPQDPAYVAARDAFEADVSREVTRRWTDLLILRAVDVEVDTAALDQFATEYTLINGEAPVPSAHPKIDYVRHVCVGSWQDLNLLQQMVTRRSIPSEEGIQAHEATF